jgi:hypothetical protein
MPCMADHGEPAHYIVFHPEYKRLALSVRATALEDRQLDRCWNGRVWVDKPPGNEDPFVLGPSWAYSYCHATQLRRGPRADGGYVRKGSCIIFCSGDYGDEGALVVDTAFWVAEAHEWMPAGGPPSRYEPDVTTKTEIWRFHLRFGSQPGGHKGAYTYEAALYPQSDGCYSQLPLGATGDRVCVPICELSVKLGDLVRRGFSSQKGPVLLGRAALNEILGQVAQRTTTEIVGDIQPVGNALAALRKRRSDGCRPSPCGETCENG